MATAAPATTSPAKSLGIGWKVLLANESAPREVFTTVTVAGTTTIFLTQGEAREFPADEQIRVVS